MFFYYFKFPNIFFFECKQVGGFDDLTLTIYTEQYLNILQCEFKSIKPRIIRNISYHTYTRTYRESITDDYNRNINFFIDKPSFVPPPKYEEFNTLNRQ